MEEAAYGEDGERGKSGKQREYRVSYLLGRSHIGRIWAELEATEPRMDGQVVSGAGEEGG